MVDSIRDVYGWSKEEVGRVVFKYPHFAGRDHERVMRNLSSIGRIVGLDEGTVKEKIMKNPKLAGCLNTTLPTSSLLHPYTSLIPSTTHMDGVRKI